MSHSTRKYLVEHTPEFLSTPLVTHATAAVVNASDTCALSCPHCLYAAVLTKRKSVKPPEISMEQAHSFVTLMNQASLEHLIFSGGGESYENLPVMCYMLENLVHLKQVVTVTSGYFASTKEQTEEVFSQLFAAIRRGQAQHDRPPVSFLLRLSYDNSHDVPVESIVNAVNHCISVQEPGIEVRVVIRTLLDPSENKDVLLAERLGGILVPEKDSADPTRGMPIIDGFPTRWIQLNHVSLPVIYKPTYFEGLAYKSKRRTLPGASWQEVKAVEEEHDNFFNLSLRGPQGEGHNYYETILKGYDYWKQELGESPTYVTAKTQALKGYNVYLPADGRMIINASAPDSHVPVTKITSWSQYLRQQLQDVLQYHVVSYPTDHILELAKEVEPTIGEIIDRRNFVFSLAYTAMETPALRLYLTLRLLQQTKITFADSYVRQLVGMSVAELSMLYANSGNTLSSVDPKQSLHRDPIVGNEPSIHSP